MNDVPHKIYDCLLFDDELDMLEIHLNVTDEVIDHWVIVEATKTFNGKAKPLYFSENKSRFEKFLPKIIQVVVDDFPDENYIAKAMHQRNAIMRGLVAAQDQDWIIIADVDEIPRPEAIRLYDPNDGLRGLNMEMYYYYLNCRLKLWGLDWRFAKIIPYGLLKTMAGPQQARDWLTYDLPNAGWHFSYFGGVDKIIRKIESLCETQFNTPYFKDPFRLQKALEEGQDLFCRPEMQAQFVPIPDTFPRYILDHLDEMKQKGFIKETIVETKPRTPLTVNFDKLQNSIILVTGGAGTIGSHVVDACVAEGAKKVIVYDNFSAGNTENIKNALGNKQTEIEVKIADITHPEDLEEAMQGVDYVFHEASVLLLESMKKPQKAIDINIQGTFNVFQAALKAGVKKVVWASSASVFGEPIYLPVNEDHPFNNKTFYGATKIACEAIAKSLNFSQGLKHVGLRYYNVYGPRQGIRGAYAQIIPRWCEKIEQGQPIIIFSDGTQSMDLIYVEDIAQSNICAMKSDCTNDFFNIGTGVETTVKQLAEVLLEVANCDLKPVYEPHDVNLVKRRQCSVANSREKTGFEAKTSLREGLTKYWQWRHSGIRSQ